MKRALFSTSNKAGLAGLARRLVAQGFSILSTGGTAAALQAEGIPVVKVADYTGAEEILGGRVKTLHPRIHGGILARPTLETDRADMDRAGVEPIELVVVNLYPFRETAAREGVTFEEVVEEIDIGGPTLLRAAAKNFEHVTVVVRPEDYDRVAEAYEHAGPDRALRYELATHAFAHTAAYDAAIVEHLSSRATPDAKPSDLPGVFARTFEKAQDLRYGENPHQTAAFYLEPGTRTEPVVADAAQLQGKELSFNNLVDADAALEAVKSFDECAAVVVKHTNPCGVAVRARLEDAYRAARATDETSAFGSVVALNRAVDEATALALAETFLEIVIAPGFEASAREVLAKKKNLRLLELPALAAPRGEWHPMGLDLKKVGGGLLVQTRDLQVFGDAEPQVVTRRAPTDAEWRALRFAWRVCQHVKSNAIVFASDGQLVGVGAGQMSRVDAVRIAVERATLPIEGTVVASDAFFPFRDNIDVLAGAGATAVIQPGGSKRDGEVVEAADEHGLAMVMTGVRHFRH